MWSIFNPLLCVFEHPAGAKTVWRSLQPSLVELGLMEKLTIWVNKKNHSLVKKNKQTNKQTLLSLNKRVYRLCQKNVYNFQVFIAEKVNKAQQQPFGDLKHTFPVCKKIFKCYHSMVRCKSYGPLSDEW